MTRPQTPLVAVDVVVELRDRPDRPVVLIGRRNPPLGWALPGGFVDIGETVEQAAVREIAEETGLKITAPQLLGVYSDPDRDPRGHTVSVVFAATGSGQPRAGDDAGDLIFIDPRQPPETVFDHGRILADYCRRFRNRR
ncbi:MAG: NUDIX hydrolase [Gammaproteobacteria bacterium SG8_31]|jgi:8-oxo-dGTP diphosphatase|nr:MAG: NUDIX hydrolase [Gammaproteobacteria bacterium SG8_31]